MQRHQRVHKRELAAACSICLCWDVCRRECLSAYQCLACGGDATAHGPQTQDQRALTLQNHLVGRCKAWTRPRTCKMATCEARLSSRTHQ